MACISAEDLSQHPNPSSRSESADVATVARTRSNGRGTVRWTSSAHTQRSQVDPAQKQYLDVHHDADLGDAYHDVPSRAATADSSAQFDADTRPVCVPHIHHAFSRGE